jgi:ABC-type cobalamin/Fe3+-siderophores transport systems, ATPase components
VSIAEQAMQSTDLIGLANRSVMDLSGGERQRCMIARALAQMPKSSCWMSLPRFSIFSTRLKSVRLCAGLKRNVV